MNKTVLFSLLTMVLLLLTSCKTKEEKVIDNLTSLYERIDKDGANYDQQQWQDVFNEMEAIMTEAKTCDFTQEQAKQVGELQGKLTILIAKKGAGSIGNGVLNSIKKLGSFTDGFKQGLKGNGK